MTNAQTISCPWDGLVERHHDAEGRDGDMYDAIPPHRWPVAFPLGPGERDVELLAEAFRAHDEQRHSGEYPHLGQDNDIRRFAEWVAAYLRESLPQPQDET